MAAVSRGAEDGGDAVRRSHHARNVALLAVVFVLFGGFALAEIFAAFASSSLSLLGDAASMVVDSLTYALNMLAERRKGLGISERTRIKLELFIPLASVTALFATSVYVLEQAITTILDPPASSQTGDTTMLVFSTVNLVIDVISVFNFARVNRLLGYAVTDVLEAEAGQGVEDDDVEDDEADGDLGYSVNGNEGGAMLVADSDMEQSLLAPERASIALQHKSNTNMCSAYTHVIADTMRSIAVMIAAALSLSFDSINADVADAWAAVAVSVIIFLSLFPLLRGLVQKYRQLKHHQ
ncbi:Hypothetical Protein FCC1311_110582 [Hondaea fermentalgiana]|uniref:Cation efflux protein transmembrane domain-containing protein n=1 Tax=Hondaea fermentalgiana TaxID=2315210 RepID=A0A2R5GVG2_9STRA|nr:Hypothetical Protein FCC1311_110582 [Hondaea fermentalgiana]|eukprot:GBG34836.1 Hypothetical Protein FCC1311_110582 [Hondaea fermentalgiana]